MDENSFLSLFDSLTQINLDFNKNRDNNSKKLYEVIENVLDSVQNYHKNENNYGNVINNKNYKFNLVNSDNKLLKYSSNRLVTGISSSNNNSRNNFALCLHKLLVQFDDFINHKDLFELYFDVYAINSNTLNKEIKYIYLGRLEVLLVFYKSGLFTKIKDDELLLRVIKSVWEVYDHKTYLQDSSVILLMLILYDLDEMNDNILKRLKDDMKKRIGVTRSLEIFISTRFSLNLDDSNSIDQLKLDNNYPVFGSYIYSLLYYIRNNNMDDISVNNKNTSNNDNKDISNNSGTPGTVELFDNLVNIINYGIDCGSMSEVKMNLIRIMIIIRYVNEYKYLLKLFNNFNFFIRSLIKYYRYSNTSHIKTFVNNYLVYLSEIFKTNLFYGYENLVNDNNSNKDNKSTNSNTSNNKDVYQKLEYNKNSKDIIDVNEIDKNINVDLKVYVDMYNKMVNEFINKVYCNSTKDNNINNSNTSNNKDVYQKLEYDVRYNLLVKMSEYDNIYKNIAIFDRLIKAVIQYYSIKGSLKLLFERVVESLNNSNKNNRDNSKDNNNNNSNYKDNKDNTNYNKDGLMNVDMENSYSDENYRLKYFLYLMKLVITNSNYNLLGNYLNYVICSNRLSDKYNTIVNKGKLEINLYVELLVKYIGNILNNYDKLNKFNCNSLYENFVILKDYYLTNRSDNNKDNNNNNNKDSNTNSDGDNKDDKVYEFNKDTNKNNELIEVVSKYLKLLENKENTKRSDGDKADNEKNHVVTFVVSIYLMMVYLYGLIEVDELMVYYFNTLYDYLVVNKETENNCREKFDLLYPLVVYYTVKNNGNTNNTNDYNEHSKAANDNNKENKLFNSVNKLIWRMVVDKFNLKVWKMVLSMAIGDGMYDEFFTKFKRMEIGLEGSDETETIYEGSEEDIEEEEFGELEDNTDDEEDIDDITENEDEEMDDFEQKQEENQEVEVDEEDEELEEGSDKEDKSDDNEEYDEHDENESESDEELEVEEYDEDDGNDIVLESYTDIVNELTSHGGKRMRPSKSMIENYKNNDKLVCYSLLLDIINNRDDNKDNTNYNKYMVDGSKVNRLMNVSNMISLFNDYVKLKNNVVHRLIVKLHQYYENTYSSNNSTQNSSNDNNTKEVASENNNEDEVQELIMKVVNMSLFNRKLKNVAYQMVDILNGVVDNKDVNTLVVNYLCYCGLTCRTNFSTEQLYRLFCFVNNKDSNNSNKDNKSGNNKNTSNKDKNICLLNLFKILEMNNKYMNKPLVRSQILLLHSRLVGNNYYNSNLDLNNMSNTSVKLVERIDDNFVKYIGKNNVKNDLNMLLEMVKELGSVGNENNNNRDDNKDNTNYNDEMNKDYNLRNKQYVKALVRCINSLYKYVTYRSSNSDKDTEKLFGDIAESVKFIKDKKVKKYFNVVIK